MKCTGNDIKKTISEMKLAREPLWVRLWARPLSYYLAAFCVNLGISANTVSVVAIVDAILGSILFAINNEAFRIIGLILLVFWICLDCIDGNIARYKVQNSLIGEFFDALGGYTFNAFAFFSISIAAYQMDSFLNNDYKYIFIVLGGLSSITDILARLVYQKYTANILSLNQQLGINDNGKRDNDIFYQKNEKMSLKMISLWIDRLVGQANLFGPFLIVSYLFGILDILTVFYAIYHILGLAFALFMYCKKAVDFKIKYLC